jgi:hypothetical protein
MATILTPLEFSGTETLSRRLFRKKVLPIDSIDYNGRKIDFTQQYLQSVVDSFNDGAFDNVPLQFADASNAHTNDPERYRGDVVAMELASDGLYVTVSATPEGAKVLEENNKLGISARIVNDYARSDGKSYQAAVQHVLATHDPRIPGLGPWSSVESFSNDNDKSDIIDLTDSEFRVNSDDKTKKGKSVADDKDTALSADELGKLRALLANLDADEANEGADADTDADASDEDLTDEELQLLLNAVEAEDAAGDADVADEVDAEVKVPATAGAELSNDTKALELANAATVELAAVRKELAESRWAATRVSLMKEYNLPPAIVDRAAPVLKSEGQSIELSNGDKTDSAAVMRSVLQEVGNLVKLLDLSNELGTGVEETPDRSADAKARRDETTKAVRAMMGS